MKISFNKRKVSLDNIELSFDQMGCLENALIHYFMSTDEVGALGEITSLSSLLGIELTGLKNVSETQEQEGQEQGNP